MQLLMSLFQKRITLSLSFSLGTMLKAIAVVLFLGYVSWEYFWFQRVGLAVVKWHTHIVFTGVVAAALLWPVYLLLKSRFGSSNEKPLLVTVSIWIAIVMLEGVLLITGFNKDYTEERFGYYQSPYQHFPDNVYQIFHRNDTSFFGGTEFRYKIPFNALGYPGSEWSLKKNDTKRRVICGGDSFTAGDGASIDSSYPVLMQTMLPSWDVLNGGVCGSDPIQGVKNLEDRLLPFRPDLYVQTIAFGDLITDIEIRGGFERFDTDSTIRFRNPPWWEPIYAASYVGRIFFHLAKLRIAYAPIADDPDFIQRTNVILNTVLSKLDSLGRANNFQVLVVLLPEKYELKEERYSFDYAFLKERIEQLPVVQLLDLMPCYVESAKAKGLSPLSFYWVIDGHHNSVGYLEMARCIAEFINQQEGSSDSGITPSDD